MVELRSHDSALQVSIVCFKPLEFETGKAGVVAGTMEKLPGVIDTLIGAIRAGELDPMLEQAKTPRSAPKKKAA
jgi:hypothetical protein